MGCYYLRSEKFKNVRKGKGLFFVKVFFVEYDLLKLMFVKIWEDEIWFCVIFLDRLSWMKGFIFIII